MKKLSIALILALALVLSGCSMLREDGAPAQEDRLVGIYITPEYVDTFDLEAYFEDNASSLINGGGEISSQDAAKYSQRIYATDNGGREGHIEFPMWGIPLISARYEEDGESYIGNESSDYMDQGGLHVYSSDDGERYEMSGTIYADARGHVQAYCNPVYQQADGSIYLVTGQGMSSNGMGTMTFTLSEDSDAYGDVPAWGMSIELDITATYPTERVAVLLYGADGSLMSRTEYAPGEVPETIAAGDAAFAVVEDYTMDDSGEAVVERQFLTPGESFTTRTLAEGESFYAIQSTTLTSPDSAQD